MSDKQSSQPTPGEEHDDPLDDVGEETIKRPAVPRAMPPRINTLQPVEAINLDFSVAERPTEKTQVPTLEDVDVAQNSAADQPTLKTSIPPLESRRKSALNGSGRPPSQTSRPPSQSQRDQSVADWIPPKVPPTPAGSVQAGLSPLSQQARAIMACVLLALVVVSSLLLWRDSSDTHLFAYTLDARSGHVVTQQDLGGGYLGTTTITPPAQTQAGPAFGVHNASNRQVVIATGSTGTWRVTDSPAVSSPYSTLSVAPGGELAAEYADGVQVLSAAGEQLWGLHAQQPAQGAHRFQPAFDARTLYTAKFAGGGQIAAYDLHTGTLQWAQTLNDQLTYAAPLLLSGEMLYIASNTRLSALNRADGRIRWQVARPTRTLLLLNTGQRQFLLSAGARGLAALDPATGSPVWTLNSSPAATLTPVQFYQASRATSPAASTIYATGIAWDTRQVRPELWLYAVDANGGTVRWTRRLTSDALGVDAGRTCTPLLDTADGQVVLQQRRDNGDTVITAFDARDGSRRWSSTLVGIAALSPTLAQTPGRSLVFLATARGGGAVFQTWTPARTLLMIGLGPGLLALLLLWIYPWRPRRTHLQDFKYTLLRALIYPLKLVVRLWRLSRVLFALLFITLLVGVVWLEYMQLDRPQSSIYQLTASSGTTQWQHSTTPVANVVFVDEHGSIVNQAVGESLHQLAGFDSGGGGQWNTFTSAGSFSVPGAGIQPGTILVALSGHSTLDYRFAPDDPAYTHPLDHQLTFLLLKRLTGQAIWQRTIVAPNDQQQAIVLGSDARFAYLASSVPATTPGAAGPATQLVAVDLATGASAWHIAGPQDSSVFPHDNGTLLTLGRQLIWQVSSNIYSIDVAQGKVRWHNITAEDSLSALPQEETQMVTSVGLLFITRSDQFHVFDLASGNELWTVPNPGPDSLQKPSGLLASGHTLLVYGGGQLQAIDTTTQSVLWSQKQLDAVLDVHISDDGKIVYALLVDSIEGSSPAQALVAFDMRNGTALWTFQPGDQTRFLRQRSGGFQYRHGVIFTAVCFPDPSGSCPYERLYALKGSTGGPLWKVDARHILAVYLGASGDIVLFQAESSAWQDLLGRFRG
ncbi:MAG: PQQ-binding-like beta-propeller repeat protein [Ktedonobacteraceae bacterium]|nr:PQQ-binding-like beta-propeller repeat protein [Ktedonobacteraceae bacterium]